jgi:hypothetical protein
MVQKQMLASLPDVETLQRLSQSLAMLDAIMSPDWEDRYYSFNSKWSKGEMMASMRDGSGDNYFILFNRSGAIIKGFAHESPMSPFANVPPKIWSGVFDKVPSEFQEFLTEPAFSIEETTFCIWRRYSDLSWQVGDIHYPQGDDPDGSEDLLWILDGNPENYQHFVTEYYEQDVPLSAVQHIYAHKPLTYDIISKLNAEISKKELLDDIKEVGYLNGAI